MTAESNPASLSKPIFGKLSVAAPFMGGLLILICNNATNSDFEIFLVPLFPICGIVFGILAMKRREQYHALSLMGLILNLATVFIIVLLVLNSFGHC